MKQNKEELHKINKPKFTLSSSLIRKIPGSRKLQVHYISDYFSKSLVYLPKDEKLLFGLPNPYIVPDHRHFREFFYWDSFFIFVGLLLYADTKEFCRGILENFSYELKRFDRIPNSNAFFSLSRSQSPYFAMGLWEYLKVYPEDLRKKWMAECVEMATKEYFYYWLSEDKRYSYHLTPIGLSRYWDINCDSDLFAEYESGWDTSSRLHDVCMEIAPIDLNSQLYLYEAFFHWYHLQTKNIKEAKKWITRMGKRKKLIETYCWDNEKGIYFDYNFVKEKRTGFISAASFFPFYAKMAEATQAKRSIRALLDVLEKDGGIVTTQKVDRKFSEKNQWDYPHGWVPLQYIVYTALQNYGFIKEAERIKNKWLKLCDYWFGKDRCFYEKYNVVDVGRPVVTTTPARPGFGWTNALYLKFLLED